MKLRKDANLWVGYPVVEVSVSHLSIMSSPVDATTMLGFKGYVPSDRQNRVKGGLHKHRMQSNHRKSPQLRPKKLPRYHSLLSTRSLCHVVTQKLPLNWPPLFIVHRCSPSSLPICPVCQCTPTRSTTTITLDCGHSYCISCWESFKLTAPGVLQCVICSAAVEQDR